MKLYSELSLDIPFLCPICKKEIIKFKHMKHCNDCENEIMLTEERRLTTPVINKDTDYEGIDWDQLYISANGGLIKKVKKIVDNRYYNILICGYNKGISKTTTGMVISYHERMAGKRVIFSSMASVQDRMVTEGGDAYEVCRKLIDCDILIVDEIGRGIGKSTFFRGRWHEILEERLKYNKPIILIGNVGGLHRPDGTLGDINSYASDYFEGDRLKKFDEFVYTGDSYRGRQ